MKSVLDYIWKRRWCWLLIAVVLLCGLPMQHPYLRQSIFGPKIDGIPWCVWEEDLRREAHRGVPEEGWAAEVLKKIGLWRETPIAGPVVTEDMLPLYLHLAEDGDAAVRYVALGRLTLILRDFPDRGADMLPVLRRRLKDSDPSCRVTAAFSTWHVTNDPKLKEVVLPLLHIRENSNRDRGARDAAVRLLGAIGAKHPDPDIVDAVAELVDDSTPFVRCSAVRAMGGFGQRGLPTLQKAMNHRDEYVRLAAVDAAGALGKDAEPLIPAVTALCKDPYPPVRESAKKTLAKIDPRPVQKKAAD